MIKNGDAFHSASQLRASVDFKQPLPQFDQMPLKAYSAKHLHGQGAKAYALMCENALMPRLDLIETYHHDEDIGLSVLIDYGTIYHPNLKRYVFVFVYEYAHSVARLHESNQPACLAMNPRVVMERAIPRFIKALRFLEDKKLIHGSICLKNMYQLSQGGNLVSVTLGDMLALPCGYVQSPYFRTAEKSYLDRNGYGKGSHADDIYAFGVCIAMMLRSEDPCKNMDLDQFVEFKMKAGSYMAYVGQERFGGRFLEMLKGVLHDDPLKRWTVDDLLLWQNGRKLSPQQHKPDKASLRPLEFNGKKYERVSFLAKDLPLNMIEAVELIKDGSLAHWIERSLGDKVMAARLENAAAVQTSAKPEDKDAVLLSACLAALRPGAPILYKDFSFYPDALATKLIEAMDTQGDLNAVLECLHYGVIANWLSYQTNVHASDLKIKDIDACLSFLRTSRMGAGAERCVYFLSRHVPCLSPVIKSYYVQDPSDFLYALNMAAEKNSKKLTNRVLDRHMAAFLMQRENTAIESDINDLGSSDDYRPIYAELSLCGALQKKYKVKNIRPLEDVFVKNIEPCYGVYYDREYREQLRKDVKRIVKDAGILAALSLLRSKVAIKSDLAKYQKAQQDFTQSKVEKTQLQERLKEGDLGVVGQHAVAQTAFILGGALFVIMAFLSIV